MGKATLATSAVATVLAMAIAGLWHGPAWTFVIFGLLHGVALAANQVWRRRKLPMPGWRIAAILQKDNQTLLKPTPE
jgi:alginate O-acetyltransferase complex protein AlgI